MTTQEGNNAVVARHLEALANAAKEYTLAELANISVSGESYTLPTASETLKGGVKIGAGLQMDGDTLNVTIQSGSSGGTVGILDTVSSTVDGAFWYEVTDDVPALWFHKGNYDYRYTHDKIRLVGNTNDALVAYLPFTTTLDDACGNEWTVTGSPAIVDGVLSLNGGSYLTNSTIADSIGAQSWTIDFWATANPDASAYAGFFGTFGGTNNSWVCIVWNGGNPQLNFYSQYYPVQLNLSTNTRHHYAVTYDGTDVRFFVDGSLGYTATRSVTLNGNFLIGSRSDGAANIAGTIDHFRIFKGVALWTENFTPPTAADYA